MKNKIDLCIGLLAISLFVLGCQQEANSNKGAEETPTLLQTTLPGTWEAVSIKVSLTTVDSTEVDSLFEVSEEYWVQKFSIKPVTTIFQPDNKFRQEFRNSQDSMLNEVKGIWNVFGDTLMLIEPNATYTYLVDVSKGLITFNATLDWDGDGATDDLYQGVHRKISSSY